MIPMTMSRPLTPLGRDVRHYEWDISNVDEVEYEAGDAMGVFSTNGVAPQALYPSTSPPPPALIDNPPLPFNGASMTPAVPASRRL